MLGVVLFLVAYVYVMFFGDELVGIDIAHLTVNQVIEPVVSPESGRFFPLAFQWYNLLGAFGKSAELYHAWATLELAVLAVSVVYLLRDMPLRYGVLALGYMIALPSIAYAFMNLPYPERDLVFCIALWIVAIQSFRRTQSRGAFAAAIVLTQLLLYQKETSFVLIGGFSGASLLLRHSGIPRAGRYAAWARANALELAQLALCGVFLAVYAFAILPYVTASYAAGGSAATASLRTLTHFIRYDLVLVAAAVTLSCRVARRRTLDPLWEPLLIGAIAFAAAYVKLGMTREYYLAPADLVFALYLARILHQSLLAWARPTAVVVCLGLTVTFGANVTTTARSWAARRSTVDAYLRLASFLRSEAEARSDREVTLFFPQPGGFEVMEFAAFLHFKGWTAKDGPAPRVANGPAFTLKTRHPYLHERCFLSQPFRCRPVASPDSGDLIVLLPGRSVAPRELMRWHAHADPIAYPQRRASLTTSAMRWLAIGNLTDGDLSDGRVMRSRGAVLAPRRELTESDAGQ